MLPLGCPYRLSLIANELEAGLGPLDLLEPLPVMCGGVVGGRQIPRFWHPVGLYFGIWEDPGIG